MPVGAESALLVSKLDLWLVYAIPDVNFDDDALDRCRVSELEALLGMETNQLVKLSSKMLQRLVRSWVTGWGRLVLSNQGGVCGLMQQRSFGVRRFDASRHERLVAWCYAESSFTDCHPETGVGHL